MTYYDQTKQPVFDIIAPNRITPVKHSSLAISIKPDEYDNNILGGMKTVSNEIGRTKASITNLDILLMKVCNLFVIDKGEKKKKKIQLKP